MNAREAFQRQFWRRLYVSIFGWRFGFEYSPLFIRGRPYMTRYVLYLGPINLRLHHFFRGDDDRAPHNHPWWFITFPFASYREQLWSNGHFHGSQVVEAFRFHYRPASHEHIVTGRVRVERDDFEAWTHDPRPFWTFVIAGKFVPWWEWS